MTQTQYDPATQNRNGYCPRCGSESPIGGLVDETVGRKLDDLGNRLNAELDLGEVEDRAEKRTERFNKYMWLSLGEGLLKTGGLFTLANTIVPESLRPYANAGAALYVAGKLLGWVANLCLTDVAEERLEDIQDRLKAHPPKKKE
ncbi:MAG: hypothetical protein KJ600_04690 [Nanoarchaeota archaeon]|nr:hypothetical protein [Nanoarchaeota archaeon]MBU1103826.1 hypothetical protein [Nanoarchaeota archaeon]